MTKPTGRPTGRPAKRLEPCRHVKQGRLPFGPLYAELTTRQIVTARQVGDFYGVDKHTVSKWCRKGMGTFTADRLAIKLGLLPVLVWGDDFFDERLLEFDARANGHQRKFTDAQVRQIRERLDAGIPPYLLAREFGVTNPAIYEIRDRRSYADVA